MDRATDLLPQLIHGLGVILLQLCLRVLCQTLHSRRGLRNILSQQGRAVLVHRFEIIHAFLLETSALCVGVALLRLCR
jgi:hypothetical protein